MKQVLVVLVNNDCLRVYPFSEELKKNYLSKIQESVDSFMKTAKLGPSWGPCASVRFQVMHVEQPTLSQDSDSYYVENLIKDLLDELEDESYGYNK